MVLRLVWYLVRKPIDNASGIIKLDNPYIEYMAALNEKEKTVFLILLNNDDEKQTSLIKWIRNVCSLERKSG